MSTDRETELNLASDAPAAADFLAGRGGHLHWPVDGDPCIWWAEMRPAANTGETYFARIRWSVYPGAPPSIKFATAVGGSIEDPRAWPMIGGYRPPSLDICKPFTAEGYALHPDWADTNQAWTGEGNPFVAVVSELQRDLNSPGYGGRYGL